MEGRQELKAGSDPRACRSGYSGVLAYSVPKHLGSGISFCGLHLIAPASARALDRAAALPWLLSSVGSQAGGRWLHRPLHVQCL